MTDLVVERHDAHGLHEHRDELMSVYRRVYADMLHDPFRNEDAYWGRLEAYSARNGFVFVAGRINGAMIGYGLGYPLTAGSRWWRGFRGDVDTTETGHRTLAVNELVVLKEHRRHGYAKALHDALLTGRYEERATLLVRPDNVPAVAAYTSWGWRKIGQLQPALNGAPLFDSMLLDLKTS